MPYEIYSFWIVQHIHRRIQAPKGYSRATCEVEYFIDEIPPPHSRHRRHRHMVKHHT